MTNILNISRSFWISIYLFLAICPIMGQIKKNAVSIDDYKRWGTLSVGSISDNALWASYTMTYENSIDTLFIKNTDKPTLYSITLASNGMFLKNNFFCCLLSKTRFMLFDLERNKKLYIENITDFISLNSKILLTRSSPDGKKSLLICNLKGHVLKEITDIGSFCISPDKSMLVCTKLSHRTSAQLYNLIDKISITNIPINPQIYFDIIKWNSKNGSVLLSGSGKDALNRNFTAIIYYKIREGKNYFYSIIHDKNIPDNFYIDGRHLSSFVISDDMNYVFFKARQIIDVDVNSASENVQIWNTTDKDLYPKRKAFPSGREKSLLFRWNPETGKTMQIGSEEFSYVLLNGDQLFALLCNSEKNKPSFKQKPELDFSILDIKTGEITPFLTKQQSTGLTKTMSFSPQGNFVSYFKDENWWLYDFKNKSSFSLTGNIKHSFANNSTQYGTSVSPYGFAGWTENDRSVVIYDKYDLWEFDTKTRRAKRLTDGRENKIIYKLVSTKPEDLSILDSKAHTLIPGENTILNLKTDDNSKTGIAFLDRSWKLQRVFFDSVFVSAVKKGTGNSFIYTREKFNMSPNLTVKINMREPRILFNSNPHQKDFLWGNSRLIKYKNSKGETLNGALFFPAGYDKNKSYPMIVNVYEKQSSKLHRYFNPTLLNGCSFNVSNYTNSGYFVLLPDISYELGNPGFSALECVTEAVNEVLSNYPVNSKELGIMGHSFGGFEVNFIITQTNLFSAAISGASLSDLNSAYLTFNKYDFIPEAWRFETFQMRMGSSLFENYDGYQNNSPVRHASNISTPLLSYTGDSDTAVEPLQSKEFHLALRRLQKLQVLLIYPNENHVFTNKSSQIDLTQKSMEWFGHFLKHEPKPKWMNAY